jgi:citrate synthase
MLIKSIYDRPMSMLQSDEAARRLGVKLATLYAYVSRGLLVSHRSPDGRRSLFSVDDIERLARRTREGQRTEGRLATVTTSLTQLRDDGPTYRGRSAVELARTASFESVADLFWAAEPGPWEPVPLGPVPPLSEPDRLAWAVLVAAAADPTRSDIRRDAVVGAGRRIVSTMVSALPEPQGDRGDTDGSIAHALAARLVADPSPAVVRAVNAAMVLLVDHELATSTLAVRVAASARADPYDALLAGLSTVAGALHGGASSLVHALLVAAEHDGPVQAVDDAVRGQRLLPGFGHPVYRNGDPRLGVLMECVADVAGPGVMDLVTSITELARARQLPEPNLDLGLGALTYAGGMSPAAGRTIFTIPRVVGWVGHYLEELQERPLRFRARAVYVAEP